MAGAFQEIELGQFGRVVQQMKAEYEGMTFEEAWPAVSFAVSNDFKKNFDSSSDPDGNPWLPLKKLRRRNKRGRGKGSQKPLRDTDLLMGSTGATGETPTVYRTTGLTLEQGTNLEYAATHNYGDPSRGIPERRFIGVGERLANTVEKLLAMIAEKKMAGK